MFKISLKSFLPKSLLSRMLLIITLPILLAQLIAVIIFYERHWDTVEKKMLRSLVDEISFMNLTYKNLDKEKLKIFKKHSSIIIKIINKKITLTKNIHKTDNYKTLVKLQNLLKNSIREKFEISYSFKYKQIIVDIHHPEQDLLLIFSRKRIYTPTTAIFIYWVIGSSSLLLLVTIIFAKNQIRSITNLSIAAEKLGKGEKNINFKPQGALEVKKAGQAFLDMQQRIENQIRQRTELLAGVSHDLKTPITRIKLQLELLTDMPEKHALLSDLQQMENTLNDYLDFAKGEEKYSTKLINLGDLLKKIFRPYEEKFKKYDLKILPKLFVNIRENQFIRAISNFLDNAAKFATEVSIKLTHQNNFVVIEIHDNGPGITEPERENVLKPFYRIENSRNQSTGGIGLGMSIARDIILRHGGSLTLSKSYLGGLLVIIKLPL